MRYLYLDSYGYLIHKTILSISILNGWSGYCGQSGLCLSLFSHVTSSKLIVIFSFLFLDSSLHTIPVWNSMNMRWLYPVSFSLIIIHTKFILKMFSVNTLYNSLLNLFCGLSTQIILKQFFFWYIFLCPMLHFRQHKYYLWDGRTS